MDRGMPGETYRRGLTVDVRRTAGSSVVAPVGELDHHSADKLRSALHECVVSGGARIVIDCSGLEFCDSTGLNVLLATRLEAEQAGGGVHLAEMPPIVARILEITGATAVFTVHETLDEALAGPPGD
ncbi:anti-sigma factor antagonist [Streptomyces sp. 3MP-14]|uniref:Anti-sigma factor antagonist n=1 Tax=Streptomyces mimosae TaxID=2586635 RepID=A0A5N5ZUF5_9ACTN|nr:MULTISPECIES: STAS domain-containing protein [Streptomyces]KAB8160154.1 anti-sigma factor antagonist [Streptomyces mimosae]KAB8176677.1 anti-sigma factor antagonist [Streptomyces sp. 3MP-14]